MFSITNSKYLLVNSDVQIKYDGNKVGVCSIHRVRHACVVGVVPIVVHWGWWFKV